MKRKTLHDEINKDTETLDKLYLEWSQFTEARTSREILWSKLYNELLLAVGNKYPGEERHETALRYIREAESRTDESCKQS